MTTLTKNTKTSVLGYSLFIVFILVLDSLLNFALADENNADDKKNQAVSIGQFKNNQQSDKQRVDTMRKNLLVNAAVDKQAIASGELRADHIAKKKQAKGVGKVHRDFDIFQAQSYLLRDADHDGYHQEFTISFDADVHGYSAEVYAELYLSKNGGPWRHYYTTDVFTIYEDNSSDEYEVFTRLVGGYDTAEYDVMIDLYEYGYNDIVASISDADTYNLHALPLESVYNDYDYQDEHSYSHGHGGSTTLMFIFALLGLLAIKYRSLINPNHPKIRDSASLSGFSSRHIEAGM